MHPSALLGEQNRRQLPSSLSTRVCWWAATIYSRAAQKRASWVRCSTTLMNWSTLKAAYRPPCNGSATTWQTGNNLCCTPGEAAPAHGGGGKAWSADHRRCTWIPVSCSGPAHANTATEREHSLCRLVLTCPKQSMPLLSRRARLGSSLMRFGVHPAQASLPVTCGGMAERTPARRTGRPRLVVA
jgi:hypothetical protein